ncbi:response regulator transcription factor [bacterium]|nr:response regulator transcription factor [bacterium]
MGNANVGTMTKSTPVKVVIIEDKQQIREGLAALINGTEGFQCTGTFDSMETALNQINAQNTDLVLVDIGLPGMSGIEGMRLFKKNYPNLLLLVLSVYEDDDRIFEALCAGASGYLLKKTSPARLLEGLRDAVNGGAPMSPEVARRVITVFREIRPPENSDYQLTPHETRLLKLLVEGHNYKTAAAELGVSVNTISFHLKHIYEKLQVHSKSEAVAKALRNRLIK